MAGITERYDSREQRISMDGATATKVWNAYWTDWEDNDVVLPRIGDVFSAVTPELICTDIDIEGLDNVNIVVTAHYSTEGFERRKEWEDQAESWTESIDLYMVETAVTDYQEQVSGNWKSWTNTYDREGNLVAEGEWWKENFDIASDASQTPELIVHKPTALFNITAYGSGAFVQRIIDNLGKINSVSFLVAYSAHKNEADSYYKTDASGADVERWLFIGCPMTRLKSNCWQFDFQFLYKVDGWNTQHDVDVDLYQVYDFNALLNDMNNIGPDQDWGATHY